MKTIDTHGMKESRKAESGISGVGDVRGSWLVGVRVFQRPRTGLRNGTGPLKLEVAPALTIIQDFDKTCWKYYCFEDLAWQDDSTLELRRFGEQI